LKSLLAICALNAIPTPQLVLFPPAMIPAQLVPWLKLFDNKKEANKTLKVLELNYKNIYSLTNDEARFDSYTYPGIIVIVNI